MLPPSTSEFDNHEPLEAEEVEVPSTAEYNSLEESDVDLNLDSEDQGIDSGESGDLDGNDSFDLGEDEGEPEEDKKPKKKMGKKAILAVIGVGIVVALAGTAFVLQEQLQPAPKAASTMAVDPSLMEARPATTTPTPAEPKLDNVAPPANNPFAGPTAESVLTPPPPATTVSVETAPMLGTTSVTVPATSTISSPPSDPFSSVSSPAQTTTVQVPNTSAVTVEIATPTTAVAVTTPGLSEGVAILPAPTQEGPRNNPMEAQPIEDLVKPAKVLKSKSVVSDSNVDVVKPRVIHRVKKPRVIKQDMTVSEQHPSREQIQPRSSESFSGYEKLF